MKKVLIFLVGALTIVSSGCRNKKAETQKELLRIQAIQDSIRRADEAHLAALKAREDSIAMNSYMSDLTPTTSYQPSAYYVVVGSFKIRSNANAYRQDMQGIFGKAEIIRNGEWNYVCVGGQFGSSSSARATLSDVKSQLVSSGGDESEDEESSEEEEETDESEDYDEESDEDLGDEDTGGSESRGQAWVLGI